eukprot:TRINITY_DN1392_c0_g1_i1.p1 TRINITY_DN1392_c0_g1~~TRINITY_DN1392_c0_g1_i1.p1  ORF type:complete len:364 (-),score=92.90 TRINITY_DN1392_c0_g1_i1:66-1157(-)
MAKRSSNNNKNDKKGAKELEFLRKEFDYLCPNDLQLALQLLGDRQSVVECIVGGTFDLIVDSYKQEHELQSAQHPPSRVSADSDNDDDDNPGDEGSSGSDVTDETFETPKSAQSFTVAPAATTTTATVWRENPMLAVATTHNVTPSATTTISSTWSSTSTSSSSSSSSAYSTSTSTSSTMKQLTNSVENASLNDESESMWTVVGDDVLFQIFTLLEPEDLAAASLVCRTWYRITSDKHVWRRLYIRRFCVPGTAVAGGSDWKKMFVSSYDRFLSTKNFTFIKGLHLWRNFGKERAIKFFIENGHRLDQLEIETLADYFEENIPVSGQIAGRDLPQSIVGKSQQARRNTTGSQQRPNNTVSRVE